MGTYIRLVDYNSQQAKEDAFLSGSDRYVADSANFTKIPGMPIAYWVSEQVFEIFEKSQSLDTFVQPRQGMATCNNNKFLRFWSEISSDKIGFGFQNKEQAISSRKKWFPYHKGGGYRKWYGNIYFVVDWEKDGQEIKELVINKYPYLNGNFEFVLKTNNPYFHEGITWSDVSTGDFACRYSPSGFMYDVKGTSMFPDKDSIFYFIGLLNSGFIANCLNVLNPTMSYQVGNIKSLPIKIDFKEKTVIEDFVVNNIEISKTDWDSFETSWDFTKHPLI